MELVADPLAKHCHVAPGMAEEFARVMVEQPEQQKVTPIEFVKEKLRENPEASYKEIKARAKLAGLTVYPVVYGRAKALLGLVPTAPYGSKSKARRQAKEAKQAKQLTAASKEATSPEGAQHRTDELEDGRSASSRGRRVKALDAMDPLSSLETLVGDLKATVAERDRYRQVLEKVVKLLQAELGGD